MRCKKHPTDLSSSIGVCASCLRDSLLDLMAAQAQVQHAQLGRALSRAAADDSRKSDAHQPHLIFPRSVSPYVARRKSDDTSTWSHHHLRFYSTPQLSATYNSSSTTAIFTTSTTSKTKHRRFFLLSNPFRSRSEKFNTDPGFPSRNSTEVSSSSPSWFSTLFSARRKKQYALSSEENSRDVTHKTRRVIDRGMSPARGADSEEDCDPSPSGSWSPSESSQWWKRTPVAPASVRRGKPGHGKNVSGLPFCLSPLVRASPKRQWNQKGGLPPDSGFSGDIRVGVKPHISTAASLCKNRSRKLCDFGRVNHNR